MDFAPIPNRHRHRKVLGCLLPIVVAVLALPRAIGQVADLDGLRSKGYRPMQILLASRGCTEMTGRQIRIDNISIKKKDGGRHVVEFVRKPRDASQARAWAKGSKKQKPVWRVI